MSRYVVKAPNGRYVSDWDTFHGPTHFADELSDAYRFWSRVAADNVAKWIGERARVIPLESDR